MNRNPNLAYLVDQLGTAAKARLEGRLRQGLGPDLGHLSLGLLVDVAVYAAAVEHMNEKRPTAAPVRLTADNLGRWLDIDVEEAGRALVAVKRSGVVSP